jgi:hypothetical protein
LLSYLFNFKCPLLFEIQQRSEFSLTFYRRTNVECYR